MILFVHDEIVLECTEAEADRWASELEQVMARDHGVVRGLVAKAEIHKRWSKFKDPGYVP